MRLCIVLLALSFGVAADVAVAACTGVNKLTGKSQAVQEIYRTGTSHPRRFFAEATYDRATGRPQIIYYARYAKAPGHFKSFVRQHECCHHLGHKDEIAANCCALRRMQLSASWLAALKSYIVSRDVNSQTIVDYSGRARCSGARRREAASPRPRAEISAFVPGLEVAHGVGHQPGELLRLNAETLHLGLHEAALQGEDLRHVLGAGESLASPKERSAFSLAKAIAFFCTARKPPSSLAAGEPAQAAVA